MDFRLKDFRQSQRMFQSDLAEVFETNQSTVSRMELTPTTDLSYRQYELLCEKFSREVVDKFIATNDTTVQVGRTANHAQDGAQLMDTVKSILDTISQVMKKQSEMNERLLNILEKTIEKKTS